MNTFPFPILTSLPQHDPRPSLAYSFVKIGQIQEAFYMIQQGQWKGWKEEDLLPSLWKHLKVEILKTKNRSTFELNSKPTWPEQFEKAPFCIQALGALVEGVDFKELQDLGIVSFALKENLFLILDQLYRKKDGPHEKLWIYNPLEDYLSWHRIQLQQNHFQTLHWAFLRGHDLKSSLKWMDIRSVAGVELLKRLHIPFTFDELMRMVPIAQKELKEKPQSSQKWIPIFEKLCELVNPPADISLILPKKIKGLCDIFSEYGEASLLNKALLKFLDDKKHRTTQLFSYVFKATEPLHKNKAIRIAQPTLKMDLPRFFRYLETLNAIHQTHPIFKYDDYISLLQLSILNRPGLLAHDKIQFFFKQFNSTEEERFIQGLSFVCQNPSFCQKNLNSTGWNLSEWIASILKSPEFQQTFHSNPAFIRQVMGTMIRYIHSPENYDLTELVFDLYKQHLKPSALSQWMQKHGPENAIIPEFAQLNIEKIQTQSIQSTLIQYLLNLLKEGAVWPPNIDTKHWEFAIAKQHPQQLPLFQKLYLENSLRQAKPATPKMRL